MIQAVRVDTSWLIQNIWDTRFILLVQRKQVYGFYHEYIISHITKEGLGEWLARILDPSIKSSIQVSQRACWLGLKGCWLEHRPDFDTIIFTTTTVTALQHHICIVSFLVPKFTNTEKVQLRVQHSQPPMLWPGPVGYGHCGNLKWGLGKKPGASWRGRGGWCGWPSSLFNSASSSAFCACRTQYNTLHYINLRSVPSIKCKVAQLLHFKVTWCHSLLADWIKL